MKKLLSTLLAAAALSAPAQAQTCEDPVGALGELAAAVTLFYEIAGGGWSDFCPDDLGAPMDIDAAAELAEGMSAEDRAVAAELLIETVAGLDASDLQAMANGAALLDALMGAMHADRQDISALLDALLALAEGSEDPLLTRQIALNLWRQGIDDPRVDALLERYLPSSPDYDRIFRDGRTTLKAVIQTGHDGFEHSDFREVFERAGATVEEIGGGPDMLITYTVRPDDPTLPEITWELTVRDGGWPHQGVFNQMDDPDLDVGMYADHSQLGTSLDRSLAGAPDAEASTDFLWIDACKSKVFASRVSRAFPEGHFVYTREAEYFRDMSRAFQRGLVSLTNHYDYDEMRRYVSRGDLYQGRNYYFPDDPGKLAFQDQDGDGIADAEDRVYNVEPIDGEPISRAVHIANTYLGYSGAFKSSEDDYRPAGVFDGDPGGERIRMTDGEDAYGQTKTFVEVSDELVGMGDTQRTALIARDMAVAEAERKGWSDEEVEAAAFLAGASVYDVWGGPGWTDYVGETLPGVAISTSQIGQYLDDHDFVVTSKLSSFIDYVRGQRE